MATPKRATRIGGGARGGQKMYLGGSKNFNEATGRYRNPGAARNAAMRKNMVGSLAAAMTKQASMRGRVGAGGGPGAANRQAMRSAMQRATATRANVAAKRAVAKRRAR